MAVLVNLGVRIPVRTLDTIAVILITLILSYFTLVLGELVPKRIAMRKAEPIALAMSGFVSLTAKTFAPVVWLLTVSTNTLLKLLGIDPNAIDDEITEEEIRMMVDAGSEKGSINLSEKEMIQNIFEFDDKTAGEVMTHRTEVVLLWLEESIEQWEEIINESRHTMYPVCDESIDNVIGVLNAKDYFRIKEKTREKILELAVKPTLCSRNSAHRCLVSQHEKSRNHFAVVLDDYGGMSGIITMNDLARRAGG